MVSSKCVQENNITLKYGYLKKTDSRYGIQCIWWSFKNRLHVRLLILIIIRIAFNLRIRFCRFLCGFFCWAWTGLWSVTTTTSGWSLSTSGISHQFSCALMTIPKVIKWNLKFFPSQEFYTTFIFNISRFYIFIITKTLLYGWEMKSQHNQNS